MRELIVRVQLSISNESQEVRYWQRHKFYLLYVCIHTYNKFISFSKRYSVEKLKSDAPKPLYQQLATKLTNQIRSKEYKAGDKLPSIRELADMYQVSNITVRRAMDLLRQNQYIYSVQGKGYFVTQSQMIKKYMPTQEGFTESVQKEGLTPSSIVLRAELQQAGSQMGRKFGIGPDSEVVVLERVRLADGVPLCIQVIYLPHELCRGILEYDFSHRSLYQTLREKYHIHMGKSQYTIQAELAGERELHHLNLEPPAAILWVQHWSYTSSGQLFEDGKTAYRTDRFQIHSPINEYELIREFKT